MPAAHIPPDLAGRLKKENAQINPSGELKNVTVMFVDMRGFSQLLEKHSAKKVLKLLDIYFRMLVSIIKKHDGIVDKFIGDGLMAVWGIPHQKKIDVYNAIRAAIEIRIGMFRIIPELVSMGEAPLEIGIGVGTGDAVIGFVGPSSWKEYTLVGSCINRAARLQAMASDNRIYIDANTAREARTFSYLLNMSSKSVPHALKEMRSYELEGLCEYNREFGQVRKHPRLVTARVAGITNVNLQKRKPALVKSIGEGGLGIEMHDYRDFKLEIGDETVFDSIDFCLLDRESTRGFVVRKQEIRGGGIYRVKTWDVGVKFIDITDEVRHKLLKIFVGNEKLQQIVGTSDAVTWP